MQWEDIADDLYRVAKRKRKPRKAQDDIPKQKLAELKKAQTALKGVSK